MRLHRLKLSAIGPFADPVDIDFDTVSASGLFLLEGPTGAGKSTLIDAIVFALYGEVAGRASSNERIASAVATNGATPSVELDFSTTHGLFRVQRTPKHERSKRRGTGTTTQNASAKLWRLISPQSGDVGEPVSTRIDEIADEITDIVGLSREQFVQTVVLPQGEFATFLRADAEHRRALLQRLFGTEVYDRTVERLAEMRRDARQRRTDASHAVQGALSAYCGAAGASVDDEHALDELLQDDPDQLLVVIQQQIDVVRSEAGGAADTVAAATVTAAEARAELTQRQRQHEARERVIELRRRVSTLDATEDEHQMAVRRLDVAERAASLVPVLTGLEDAERRLAAEQRAVDGARHALPAPNLPTGEWSEREQALRVLLDSLAPIVTREQQLQARRESVSELRGEHEGLVHQHEEARQLIANAPAAIDALRETLATAQATQARLEGATDQLAAAEKDLAAAEQLEQLMTRVEAATTSRDRAREQAHHLLGVEMRLRTAYLDGIAGQLAAELRADEECPVCGSREHPAPASRADDQVDRDGVTAASAAAGAAAEHLQSTQETLTDLEKRAAELRGSVGSISSDQAQARCLAALQVVAEAEEATAIASRLQAEIATASQQLADLRTQSETLAARVASAATSLESAEAVLAQDERLVADAAEGHASVADRVTAIGAEADLWAVGVEALTRRAAARHDVDVRATEWQSMLDDSAFSDRDEVKAGQLGADERAELRALIDQRLEARVSCETELASPELAGVDTDHEVDLTAAREAVDAAERRLHEVSAVAAGLRQRLNESESRAAEVQTSLAAARTVDSSTDATIRMADLASGSTQDNAKAMSLPTFVLRERFVDVVASANDRLTTMSDGRFRLEHIEGKRGNRRSGLELQVRDAHAEQPRDPATLSGGESFYCSLALALGLADVVTAEAGGIDLGTLFVDEGFGSLDADTLDQVLEVLHTLASSGRAVGIVSHVPELKEQIPERVSVIPNRDGSSRLVVAA